MIVRVVLLFAVLISSCWANNVMPWMGLERTGENITADLTQIESHLSVINHAAFECFNLGKLGNLVVNNLTDVNTILRKYKVETFPMVSTYSDTPPHRPPDVMEHIRALFSNPDPFITSLIDIGTKAGYSGVNIDFEPSGGTAEDASNFAIFLSTLADALHHVGMNVTVDVATWDPFWNLTLIGKSKVDRVMMMSTYAGSKDAFLSALRRGVDEIGVQKLGVGLITVNPNTGKPFTQDEMKTRFDAIKSYGITEVDIWSSPVPDDWWPFLNDFII